MAALRTHHKHDQVDRLKTAQPAQPMPAGRYECWSTSAGLSIVHIGRPGPSGERAITQVWPPVAQQQPKQEA